MCAKFRPRLACLVRTSKPGRPLYAFMETLVERNLFYTKIPYRKKVRTAQIKLQQNFKSMQKAPFFPERGSIASWLNTIAGLKSLRKSLTKNRPKVKLVYNGYYIYVSCPVDLKTAIVMLRIIRYKVRNESRIIDAANSSCEFRWGISTPTHGRRTAREISFNWMNMVCSCTVDKMFWVTQYNF